MKKLHWLTGKKGRPSLLKKQKPCLIEVSIESMRSLLRLPILTIKFKKRLILFVKTCEPYE